MRGVEKPLCDYKKKPCFKTDSRGRLSLQKGAALRCKAGEGERFLQNRLPPWLHARAFICSHKSLLKNACPLLGNLVWSHVCLAPFVGADPCQPNTPHQPWGRIPYPTAIRDRSHIPLQPQRASTQKSPATKVAGDSRNPFTQCGLRRIVCWAYWFLLTGGCTSQEQRLQRRRYP